MQPMTSSKKTAAMECNPKKMPHITTLLNKRFVSVFPSSSAWQWIQLNGSLLYHRHKFKFQVAEWEELEAPKERKRIYSYSISIYLEGEHNVNSSETRSAWITKRERDDDDEQREIKVRGKKERREVSKTWRYLVEFSHRSYALSRVFYQPISFSNLS